MPPLLRTFRRARLQVGNGQRENQHTTPCFEPPSPLSASQVMPNTPTEVLISGPTLHSFPTPASPIPLFFSPPSFGAPAKS